MKSSGTLFDTLKSISGPTQFTLDPAGKQWTRGGPLDLARDWVTAGKCS